MLTIRDMMAGDVTSIRAYGTSEGAIAGWDTRGRGPKSPEAHGFKYHSKDPEGRRIYRKAASVNEPHEKGWSPVREHSVGKAYHELAISKSGHWVVTKQVEPKSGSRLKFKDGTSSGSAGHYIANGKGQSSFAEKYGKGLKAS